MSRNLNKSTVCNGCIFRYGSQGKGPIAEKGCQDFDQNFVSWKILYNTKKTDIQWGRSVSTLKESLNCFILPICHPMFSQRKTLQIKRQRGRKKNKTDPSQARKEERLYRHPSNYTIELFFPMILYLFPFLAASTPSHIYMSTRIICHSLLFHLHR